MAPRKTTPKKTIPQAHDDVVKMLLEQLKEQQERNEKMQNEHQEEMIEKMWKWRCGLENFFEEDEEDEEDVEVEMIEADSSTDAEEMPMVETVDDVDVVASGANVEDKKKLSNRGVSSYMAEWLGKRRIQREWKYKRFGKDGDSKSVPKKKTKSEKKSRKRDDTKITFSKVNRELKPRTKDMKPKKKTMWRNVQSGGGDVVEEFPVKTRHN